MIAPRAPWGLLLLACAAHAGPVDLSWQGWLLEANGAAIDGARDVAIALWADPSSSASGDLLWSHTYADQAIEQGFVALTLQGVDSEDLSGDVWLSVTVDGAPIGPRQALVHAPRAAVAEAAAGVLVDGAPTGGCSVVGAMRWDTSVGNLRVCDGSAWVYLGGGGSGGSGPVAAWSFEDALTDDSGNGFALSAAGGATVTLAGHVGSGLSLTGASGTRATVSVPAVAGNPALTVAGWFRLDAHGGGAGRGLIGVGSTANRGHFYVRAWGASSYPTCDTQPRVALGADTGSTDMWHCGTSVVPTGVWTHVAASFNPVNNSARIYVNGVLERTVTLAQGLALGTTVYVGGDGHDDNWLDGSVDDAVVYTRALADSEIAQLYANGLDAIMDNPDFEEGAVGWTATGTAFTGWPHTSCANAGACFGARGITSLAGGESATGTLTSSRFAIRQRYLCWKSGGGQSSFTAIDVDDNGSDDVVVTAYGTDGSSPSFDSWHDQCADLQAHVGKVARVRLVDNDSAGSFAWAAWDSFRAAAAP